MGEELADFGWTHDAGMTHPMVPNEAPHPVGISPLGSDAIVASAKHVAELVE
jgi:hypothetical protein